jgi:hypothetical protein
MGRDESPLLLGCTVVYTVTPTPSPLLGSRGHVRVLLRPPLGVRFPQSDFLVVIFILLSLVHFYTHLAISTTPYSS